MATTTDKPVATSTDYSSAEENPKKTLDAASPSMDKSDPPSASTLSDAEVSVKEGEGLTTTETAVGLASGESSGTANDIQKKIRRAERFGVPIQLSEQEKRNSRAERFGTAPNSKGSGESKQSEELKRKARAERFGIAAPTSATEEDAKKKSRLARFAPYSKPDSVEEEKRKSRAIRFSNPSSTTLS